MSVEAYEVGRRSDKRGVNLISDALPFGQVYGEQTQSGFQSALIVERLRGQGYGDFPWRGVPLLQHGSIHQPPLRHHRVLAAAAKELQPKILDFVNPKTFIQRLIGMQDAAAHIAP